MTTSDAVTTMTNMFNPAHPGKVLQEYIPKSVRVTEAARRLGVSRQALSALLNGRAGVSAEMALRLSKALGTSAEMWLCMQGAYDLWRARRGRQPRVRRINLVPVTKRYVESRRGRFRGKGLLKALAGEKKREREP